MAASPKSIRLSPVLEDTIGANGGGRGLSHRLSQMADRYAEILRRSPPPALSDAEMNAVRDALNGTLHEPAALIRGSIWMGVEDCLLDGLAEKWAIDGGALVERLKAMTFAQEVALVETVEAWWSTQRPDAAEA